jgi:hypothetical protein
MPIYTLSTILTIDNDLYICLHGPKYDERNMNVKDSHYRLGNAHPVKKSPTAVKSSSEQIFETY